MTTMNPLPDSEAEMRDYLYSILDDYIYQINRYSQRNRRQEREDKIHELITDIQQMLVRAKLEGAGEYADKLKAIYSDNVIGQTVKADIFRTYSGYYDELQQSSKEGGTNG